jgi:putative restriction endonuclease
LDPFHKKRGIKGLSNPGKNAINIYKDFMANWEEMIIESETLLIHYKNNEKPETTENILDNDVFSSFSQKEGKDKKRFTNTRLNQALFRKIILGNYFNTCSICGLDVASLLIASHILKWSEYKKERINPTNGICLCSIHDRAFEIGYLGITPEYKIHISKNLNSISDQNTSNALFFRHQNQYIHLPDKFHPNPDFLKLHYT